MPGFLIASGFQISHIFILLSDRQKVMVKLNKQLRWQYISIALTLTYATFFSCGAIAQIVPNNTLGVERSTVTPNVNIKDVQSDLINGGATRGANVFHSFQEFNVREEWF